MSEEAVRQTRSQKRALEKESLPEDSKRLKCDEEDEVMKASIRLQLRTGDEAAGERNTAMKSARSPSPDDVIVLSDEDPSPRVTGRRCRELDTDLLMRSPAEERESVINQLKEELRLEEAKLILLKKIRHSQTHTDSSGQKPVISVSAVLPPLLKSSTTAKAAQPVVPARPSGTVAPPPLVRGGHVTKHTQVIMPALVRGAQALSVTPQQISSLSQQSSSSGPPPLLLAPRATGTSAGTSAQGHRILQPGLIRMTSIPSASLLLINQTAGPKLKPASASECVAGVQASVKLALRKQLEKTLLEIPPAKPLASQFTFMPSAASLQFLYLLGLEEVVQNLLESLGRGQQGVYAGLVVSGEPSCCRQCETDFTSRWCEDGGGAILCEQCLSANQKQALKAQHTNRLKAAFVKALEQEQEIEQRIQKTTSSSSSSPSPSPSSSAHRVKMSRPPAAITQVSPSSRGLQASGIRSISSSSSSSSSRLQNAVVHRPGQHLVRPGSEVIRSRDPVTPGWRKRSRGAAGVTMAYMNPSLSGHKSSSALERHREFLLDMIPSHTVSHTVSHTANSWK